MEEKILSQDEINALLNSVPEEEPAGPPGRPEKLEPESSRSLMSHLFPLLERQRLSAEVENTLALIYDSFAHKAGSKLSAVLRSHVYLSVSHSEQLTYGEFIESLPEPCSFWSLKVFPVEQYLALSLEAPLVHAMVAVLMGGSPSRPAQRSRVTDLDQSIIESTVDILQKELAQNWERLMACEMSIEGKETRPRLLQMYPSSESVLLIKMIMKVGEVEGEICWGIPGVLLRLLQQQLARNGRPSLEQDRESALEAIRQRVLLAPTRLEAEIAGTRIRFRELLSLKVGDVLKLDQRLEEPVRVNVNGLPRFKANIALSRDRKAIEIVEE